MLRFFAGAAASVLLMAASFFIWRSQAQNEGLVPSPPSSANFVTPNGRSPLVTPPAASAKTTEEKRFGRADKDKDGRITRAEIMQPRQKAFAKLDKNGNGSLSFEEWAVKTSDKFAGADADRSGWLTPKEYETTKPKASPKKKCAC